MEKINTVAGALEKLNVKLGGVEGEINPKMQKVEALKKIYATLGGASEDVDELSTTYELVAKIADVAEGGNPNSVQVIEESLANPFGDVNLEELITAFNTGGASMFITIDATVLGQGVLPDVPISWSSDYGFNASGVTGTTSELSSALLINWSSIDGTLTFAVVYTGASSTDIESYSSQMPTTLTIYWHPMPETEGE